MNEPNFMSQTVRACEAMLEKHLRSNPLARVGLSADDVESMTLHWRVRPEPPPPKQVKNYHYAARPAMAEQRELVEQRLRETKGQWIPAVTHAEALGLPPVQVGNILAGMHRAGLAIDKRIAADGEHKGKTEYCWKGGQ